MVSSGVERLLWAPIRAACILGILVVVGAACGAGVGERTEVATTRTEVATTLGSTAPTVSSSDDDPVDPIESRSEAFDRAPTAFIFPRLAAFDDGLLAWGLTSSGDGALAVIDLEATGWYGVQGIGDVPNCGSAVELGDGVALIGNVESGPPIGLLIDIESRSAEPFDVPDALRGDYPSAVATDAGLFVWSTKPATEDPVVVFAFDAITNTWDQLPPPPFPADTYDTGGIWTGEKLIMLGSTEGQPSFVGASIELGNRTWNRIPDAPVATWEDPHPIWSGSELIITSSWSDLITGGQVNPFPEPLAPGGEATTQPPAHGRQAPSPRAGPMAYRFGRERSSSGGGQATNMRRCTSLNRRDGGISPLLHPASLRKTTTRTGPGSGQELRLWSLTGPISSHGPRAWTTLWSSTREESPELTNR